MRPCLAMLCTVLLAGSLCGQTDDDEKLTTAERRQKLAQAAQEVQRLQDRIDAESLIKRGARYLLAAQEKDGGWASETHAPGMMRMRSGAGLGRWPRLGVSVQLETPTVSATTVTVAAGKTADQVLLMPSPPTISQP